MQKKVFVPILAAAVILSLTGPTVAESLYFATDPYTGTSKAWNIKPERTIIKLARGLRRTPAVTAIWNAEQKPAGNVSTSSLEQRIYHGDVVSHVFHRPTCRLYNDETCSATFASRTEAVDAGYEPCKICNP
jgi:hypothetical protein